jgi:hypothetical protein
MLKALLIIEELNLFVHSSLLLDIMRQRYEKVSESKTKIIILFSLSISSISGESFFKNNAIGCAQCKSQRNPICIKSRSPYVATLSQPYNNPIATL